MKTESLPRFALSVITALCTLSVSLLMGTTVRVNAQALPPCKTPAVLTRPDVWNQGVTVQVNIDPTYNQTQRDALAAAFANWNNVRDTSCPNITFGTPTYTATPIAGPNINPSPTVAQYQVYRQDPPADPTFRGDTFGAGNSNYTFASWTYLNTAVTDPTALRQLMAHEIGHTMGLGECTNCGAKTSVMNSPVPNFNDTTGLDAPTSCDLAAVKQVTGCPYQASVAYTVPLNIYTGLSTEHWTYYYGVALNLKQVAANQVSIQLGWREQGYRPSITDNPPDSCNLSTTAMTSNGARVTFANGTVFDTANKTFTTTYVQLYGHDYTATSNGNLTDLGNNPSVFLNVGVTAGGCGSRQFFLNPSSFNMTLK